MKKQISAEEVYELIETLKMIGDPRVVGRTKHSLLHIIVITICAMLCGAQTCVDIAQWGRIKRDWLRKFLPLENGSPSHDTIARVLSLIDPNEMEIAFNEWAQSVVKGRAEIKTLSFDGKALVGTERRFPKVPLMVVNVYCHELGLAIAQTQCGSGAGESQAAAECLKLLDLKGVTVLADAGFSHPNFVEEITSRNGDYILPIKSNKKSTLREIEQNFEKRQTETNKLTKKDTGHGRKETRMAEVLAIKTVGDSLARWTGAKTIVRLTRTREVRDKGFTKATTHEDGRVSHETNTNQNKTKTSVDVSYYIASRELNAAEALSEIRKHWGIENSLHWVLDMAFSEDDWMVRAKDLARNLSLLRKIAFNLAKASRLKGSIRGRMKQAGWSDEFLAQLVFGESFDA